MMSRYPKVSIGLPVRNGEDYLSSALDSLLNQTFQDFELIISDNGSTDQTCEICKQYAARDKRIRYYRSDENHGAAWNFNRVFELSHGEYFKWAAHDDLLAPTFLEGCVKVLDSDPSIVIAHTYSNIIDDTGDLVETYPVHLNTASLHPIHRFRDLLIEWHLCLEIFGLIRRSALQETPLIGNYAHGDGILLERLALLGRFYEIPEILFFSRKHSRQSMNVYGVYRKGHNDYHNYTVWFDPSKARKIFLPTWRMLYEHISAIRESFLRPADRYLGYLYILRWVIRRRVPLIFDLVMAAWRISNRLFDILFNRSRLAYIDENRVRQSTH
jgi:glycosyltransferase involved in cell wall biosynthesis